MKWLYIGLGMRFMVFFNVDCRVYNLQIKKICLKKMNLPFVIKDNIIRKT